MWLLCTLLMAEGLPGLLVGMTLLRIVMFPFLAVTQKHGRCRQLKLTRYFSASSRKRGDLFTFCRTLISVYDSVG